MKKNEILNRMRKNFQICEDFYNDHRLKALEDFKFREGDQWDENIKRQREREKRPVLTINKLQQFIGQICNSFKRNRPSINVKGIDAMSDSENAIILAGLIKNIENQSLAEEAYDVAFENAVTCGEGYIRIYTDYEDPASFDQTIYIKPIHNIFSVYIDPNTKEPDYSDMQYAFIIDNISREVFETTYPNAKACSNGFTYEGMSQTDGWINTDSIRIVEYFYLENKVEKLYQIQINDEILALREKDYKLLILDQNKEHKVLRTRDSIFKVVKWIKSNGYEILEETDWPGVIIPIIPVFANKYISDGRLVIEGIIRQAKDAQKIYNYHHSMETEILSLAPKAPFIAAAGQIENFEDKWNSANIVNHAYLEYNPVSVDGQAVPPPQRTQFDPQIQTLINAKMSANEDIKATTGIYDQSLGRDTVELSGVAISNKQRQAELTTFQYMDNMLKALKLLGRQLVDIIPKIYDTKRMIRILGDNQNEDKIVTLNELSKNEKGNYSGLLGIGKYDVEVDVDRYGQTQKQEASNAMLEIMRLNPNATNLIADVFVGNMDFKGAKEIANRLKVLLPPQLQDPNNLSPEAQAQLQAVQQQAQQEMQAVVLQNQKLQALTADLTAELNKVKSDLENRSAEIESKERIAVLNARVELIKAGIKEDATDNRLLLEKELSGLQPGEEIGEVEIEQPEDQYVLPGVNDPETENYNKTQEDLSQESGLEGDINGDGQLSEEESKDLLEKINKFKVPQVAFGTRF